MILTLPKLPPTTVAYPRLRNMCVSFFAPPHAVFFSLLLRRLMKIPFFQVVRIAETKEGFIDLVDLENKLQLYQTVSPGAQLVGCFSAASNITGILADDIATTLILHQYGALAFWDYASAGEYNKIMYDNIYIFFFFLFLHKRVINFKSRIFIRYTGLLVSCIKRHHSNWVKLFYPINKKRQRFILCFQRGNILIS